MNLQVVYWIAGIVSISLGIAGYFTGQANGIKKKGYDDGIKDATISVSINTLTQKVDKIDKKIDEINIGGLMQRIKALEKTVYKEGGAYE